jgi:hypothetical protein
MVRPPPHGRARAQKVKGAPGRPCPGREVNTAPALERFAVGSIPTLAVLLRDARWHEPLALAPPAIEASSISR